VEGIRRVAPARDREFWRFRGAGSVRPPPRNAGPGPPRRRSSRWRNSETRRPPDRGFSFPRVASATLRRLQQALRQNHFPICANVADRPQLMQLPARRSAPRSSDSRYRSEAPFPRRARKDDPLLRRNDHLLGPAQAADQTRGTPWPGEGFGLAFGEQIPPPAKCDIAGNARPAMPASFPPTAVPIQTLLRAPGQCQWPRTLGDQPLPASLDRGSGIRRAC
jgi:hypothetical protein